MSKVSILISARGEQYEISPGLSVLLRTVQDIYEKATGDIEVIVVFDGPPYQRLPDFSGLTTIAMPEWQGTKVAINRAASISTGKYIMKVDAHCMFAEGFDEVLQADMEDNWVVMPRFYQLNAEEWKWLDDRYYDYFMLPFPFNHPRGVLFRAGQTWNTRTAEHRDVLIDENMRNHGACFFTSRDYFLNKLGGFECDGAGTWNGEEIQLTMKTWLGPWGGKVMVNKKTWFAHMHRGKQRPREFGFSVSEAYASARWSARYWMTNQWPDRIRDFDWLIEHFWPVEGWPDDWREKIDEWKRSLPAE